MKIKTNLLIILEKTETRQTINAAVEQTRDSTRECCRLECCVFEKISFLLSYNFISLLLLVGATEEIFREKLLMILILKLIDELKFSS